MRIGVAGITGRMGRLIAEAVVQSGATLVGGIHRPGSSGTDLSGFAVALFPTCAALASACDVVIDFTHANAVRTNATALSEASACWILGTTGLSAGDTEAVHRAAESIVVVQAANFSPGVTLLVALAERLARALPADQYDAEILEMHHRYKVDAPSGTALALGQAVATGRAVMLNDVVRPGRHGQTGSRPVGEIGFASMRGGQVVGEHTLLFAGDGEHISLTHKALDRAVFARGAVRAAIWAASGKPAGLYSMMDVLGMTDGNEESPR